MSPAVLAIDIVSPRFSPSIRVNTLVSGRLACTKPFTAESIRAGDETAKKASKGRKAALRFQSLIASKRKGRETPLLVSVGSSLNCNTLPSAGKSTYAKGIKTFEEVIFRSKSTLDNWLQCSTAGSVMGQPHPEALTETLSTQYLHFSCPSLRLDDAIISPNGCSNYAAVEINSGVCLFSLGLLEPSIPPNGPVDPRKLHYASPSFYEMEYMAGAAPAIADLATSLACRLRSASLNTPVKINLDVPSFHYYETVDEKLRHGKCSAESALAWLEAVQHRHDQIATVFETAVRHECKKRGNPSIPVSVSPSANTVLSGIKTALQAGLNPNFSSIFLQFCKQGDNAWSEFYQLLPQKDHPTNFRELGTLLYVYQVLAPALMRGHSDRQSLKQSSRGNNCLSVPGDEAHVVVTTDRNRAASPKLDSTGRQPFLSQPELLDIAKVYTMLTEGFFDGSPTRIVEEPCAPELLASAAKSLQRMAEEVQQARSQDDTSLAAMRDVDDGSDCASTPTFSRSSTPLTMSSSISSFAVSPATHTPQNGASSLSSLIPKPNVLIVSLDNISEQKIYSRSQSLLKELRKSASASCSATLVEAYMLQRVYSDGEDAGRELYYFDPSPSKPVDADGNEVTPADLVRILYGEECASNMARWFAEVGL